MLNHNIISILPLAISPTILISAVGLLLLMLNNRLAHSVDRARLLQSEMKNAVREEQENIHVQIMIIWNRANLLRRSIELIAASAFFSVLLIFSLFFGALIGIDVYLIDSALFAASLFSMIGGIILFLLEVRKALAALRYDLHISESPDVK